LAKGPASAILRRVRNSIRFLRRGRAVELSGFDPRTTLLDYLRLDERSFGTKEGCAEGDCGACTVALARRRDGGLAYEPVNACIGLLGQADGAELVTVEDLAGEDGLHPVQAAMVVHHGSQCGFCTPGIVMSLFALHHGARPVTRAAVNDALAGNLCRCTGYRPIVDAALKACSAPPRDRFRERRAATAAALAELDDGADLLVGNETRFFAAPASEDALASLYEAHPDATLVAGCTDVGLWVTKALAALDRAIWLGRVQGLDRIEDGAETLSLGATVSHARAHAVLAGLDPDLGALMRRFGGAQIRAAGTVGGNIANGSPIGDLAPAFLALEATLELRKGVRLRTLPLENFFLAYRRQDRERGEFVRRVIVRKLPGDEAFRCHKVSKRFDEDISAVTGACKLRLDGRRIAEARVAYGGMAEIPKRAGAAEAALVGASLDDERSWEAALSALARDFKPITDQRASADYRALVARNLLLKALVEIASGATADTRLVDRREPQAAE
jgi:xanthine dehydrogenase small subunit